MRSAQEGSGAMDARPSRQAMNGLGIVSVCSMYKQPESIPTVLQI